ncbi:4-hydroxy-tetrahydrodipicolinate reductase [Feifania hominis]|uniref:4-hydroxy-tetrahydrodipicolinate reductase n=1 Tax=Feifania hominis TaxID=2763660 RepID=A0A926DEI2_9FIRM|nr:4-hydroxy-tetrahydrodipicolinate reductase [Feifania hominis]MBC8535560.1 4-hydroxy-tetrahydrodipicolinate reductase [Feifania hominis]
MTHIILSGANGAMGRTIARLAGETHGVKIVAGLDKNTQGAADFPIYASPEQLPEIKGVLVDFSHPSAFDGILRYALDTETPLVMCTTGLAPEQLDAIRAAAKRIAVFHSANMSIGINLLADLARRAAALLQDQFDIEIIERHHNKKIDAPSGTALMLADAMREALSEQPRYVYDRHAVRERRQKNDIGFSSVRGGTIVGEHEILFAGTDELIELRHTATSKEVFAVGALRAAVYLENKGPGLYNMSNLIQEV